LVEFLTLQRQEAAKVYTGNIQIREINLEGNTKFDKGLVNAFFAPVKQAKTLEEANALLEQAKQKLEALNLFNHISITLTPPNTVAPIPSKVNIYVPCPDSNP
jgi:hypothetical protein